jgi:hypothetical protein
MTHQEQQETPSLSIIFRGSLSLFRNINHLERQCYDNEQLTNSKLKLRKGKQKRRELDMEVADPINRVISVELEEYITRTEITLLFFCHPTQQHSLRLRSTLASFCNVHADTLSCLALFGGDTEAITQEEKQDVQLFFRGTGFLTINDNTTSTSILRFLNVTHIPSLVVIPHNSGRPIMGQEVALEWNAVDPSSTEAELLLQRWKSGSAGLSLSQKIMATTLLGDSSSGCMLM